MLHLKNSQHLVAVLLSAGSLWLVAGNAQAQLPAPAGSSPTKTAASETPPSESGDASPETEPYVTVAPSVTVQPNPHGLPAPSGSTFVFETPLPSGNKEDGIILLPDDKPPVKAKVSIGGITVSGLTDAAALKKLRAALEPRLQSKLVLFDGVDEHEVKRFDLGARIPFEKLLRQARAMEKAGRSGDMPARFEVSLKVAQAAMERLAKRVNHTGGAPRLDARDGEAMLSGGDSVRIATSGSAWRVKTALEANPPRSRADLVVKRDEGTHKLSRFRYLLAEFATPFDPKNVGRTRNLKMSAENVNGTIVRPGTVFSTNQAIGPRNTSAGWKEAKMFVGGAVVNGVGAGICQCASTLYNAALLAGLPIVERHQHSFRVNYTPVSRDATIYWGQKDMKFRNNTGGSIYVQTFLRGEKFHVRFYGTTKPAHEVEVESRVLSQKNGTSSEAYRIIRTATGEKRERLSKDYYRPTPR